MKMAKTISSSEPNSTRWSPVVDAVEELDVDGPVAR
jgi:hypothetical protein